MEKEIDNSYNFELLECKKCRIKYCSDEKHKCDKFMHHGNTDIRIKPIDMGTDYFGFVCPNCNTILSVIKIRQCRGGGDEGRLIINLQCGKCGFLNARKLYQGEKINLVTECKHRGYNGK